MKNMIIERIDVMEISYQDVDLKILDDLIPLYIDSFNAEPWNDHWNKETAYQRLYPLICYDDCDGICLKIDDRISGAILGR